MKRILAGLLTVMVTLGFAACVQAETVEYVLEQTKERLTQLKDFSAWVEIEHLQNSRTHRTKARLTASQVHEVARLEITEPSILEGQIIVIFQDSLEVNVYMPIADRIMVKRADDLAEDTAMGLGIDLTNLADVFDFEDLVVELLDDAAEEAQFELQDENDECDDELSEETKANWVLRVTGFEEQEQRIWLTADWLPQKIEVYEKDSLLGTVWFRDVLVDQELDKDDISALPDVRRTYSQ